MTTVLFVHGTGVRKDAFDISFEKIASELSKLPNVSAKPCYWGHLGSELHAGGASIPEYDATRALAGAESAMAIADAEYQIPLWGILYEDPLYELRVLALRRETAMPWEPGQVQPGAALADLGNRFDISPELQRQLQIGGIDKYFEKARLSVTSSEPYRLALDTAPPELAEYQAAIARAFIAQAVALAEQDGIDEDPPRLPIPTPVAHDIQLRNKIEDLLVRALGAVERSIGGWVKEQLGGLVLRVGTWKGLRRRGAITDAAHPGTGDILLYQARGEAICDFIRDQIAQVAGPCVLLAHSLGGIACVDLLVKQPAEVKLLVTVGSQAPFLYEINALKSLPFGQALPAHFPRWLNIYDLRDFLSYKGASIFEGKVRDVKVDNREPFHWSHSAYWSNAEVWKAIAEELP